MVLVALLVSSAGLNGLGLFSKHGPFSVLNYNSICFSPFSRDVTGSIINPTVSKTF